MSAVTGGGETQRSLAVSLVSAGMGMAPMTMAPLAAWLISHQLWRTSLLVLAGVAAVLMIPATLLVRRPPTLASPAPEGQAGPPPMSLSQALRSRPFIVLVAGLLFQAVAALGYLQARSLGEFYAVAALFGFIYAGVMPLYAVLAREVFPLSMMGTVIGGTAMAGGLGMSTGPLTGGLIYDRFGSYAGLFVGAFVLGLVAVAIALAFRSRNTPEPVPAVA